MTNYKPNSDGMACWLHCFVNQRPDLTYSATSTTEIYYSVHKIPDSTS